MLRRDGGANREVDLRADDISDDSRASLHPQLHHAIAAVPDRAVRPCLARLRIKRSIGSKEAAERSIRRGTRHH